MDWLEIVNEIFRVCIIPLLGLATTYLIVWIKQKMGEGKAKAKSEAAQTGLVILEDIITTCVLATNQTYVGALKNKNIFDAEAQKQALELTYKAVITTASTELQENLRLYVGDLETYIKEKIEQKVLETK